MEPEKMCQSEDTEERESIVPVIIAPETAPGGACGGIAVVRSSAWVHFIWASAFVAIFAITAIWVLPLLLVNQAAKTSIDTVKSGIDALSMALKPSLEVNNVISHTLGELSRDKKLVVMTQTVDAEIAREKPGRAFYDYIPTGTARVRIKALENRVQFYIPLDEIGLDKFQYDPVARTLKIFAPPVKIDRDVVFVQNDPAKLLIEAKGSWVPILGPNVEELRNEVMADLKNEVIMSANRELVWQEAHRQAYMALDNFFQMLKASLRDDVKLQIYLP